MALIDKLTAIGDAIRAKTGKNDLISLSDMPEKIDSISTNADSYVLEKTLILPIEITEKQSEADYKIELEPPTEIVEEIL